MRVRLIAVACLILAAAAPPIRAQTVPPQTAPVPHLPSRDQPRPTTGTGSLRGRVTAADTGAPVRKANVELTMVLDLGSDNVSVPIRKTTMTDGQGAYEFRGLPGGSYHVTATKPAYVPASGARDVAPTVDVEDGRTTTSDIRLVRGGVIAGRVTDEYNEGVPTAQVVAMRLQYTPEGRRLAPAGQAFTNDLGQYRIFGMQPGEYCVQAISNAPPLTEQEPRAGYVPTFYPGTASTIDAQRLSVKAGQEVAGIDFALVAGRALRVTGVATDSQGQPLSGMVLMQPRGTAAPTAGGGAAIQRDGSFTITNVSPGDYVLQARSLSRAPDALEIAAVPITVGPEDLTGVVIQTRRGAAASGRVVTDDDSALPPGSAKMLIAATPASPEQVAASGVIAASVMADGAFDIRPLVGALLFRVTGIPAGWALQAIYSGTTDVTDTPLDFAADGEVNDLRVVLTTRVTTLSGSVFDARRRALRDVWVLAFPADRDRRGFGSRFLKQTRSDATGLFRFQGLPPGNYFVAAVDGIEPGAWMDPEVMQRLEAEATAVPLREAETKTVDLRPVRLAQ